MTHGARMTRLHPDTQTEVTRTEAATQITMKDSDKVIIGAEPMEAMCINAIPAAASSARDHNDLMDILTETVASQRVHCRDRKKVWYVDLKRNPDGDYVKITEACGGKRDTIVVPCDLADAFCRAIFAVTKMR